MANTIRKNMNLAELISEVDSMPNAGVIVFSAARLKREYKDKPEFKHYNEFTRLTKKALALAREGKIAGLEWLNGVAMSEGAEKAMKGVTSEGVKLCPFPADYNENIIYIKGDNKWSDESKAFCVTDGVNYQLISVYIKQTEKPVRKNGTYPSDFILSYTWDNSDVRIKTEEEKAALEAKRAEKEAKKAGVEVVKGSFKCNLKEAINSIMPSAYLKGCFAINATTLNAVKVTIEKALTPSNAEIDALYAEISAIQAETRSAMEAIQKGLMDKILSYGVGRGKWATLSDDEKSAMRADLALEEEAEGNAKIAPIKAKISELSKTDSANRIFNAVRERMMLNSTLISSLDHVEEFFNDAKAKEEAPSTPANETHEAIPAMPPVPVIPNREEIENAVAVEEKIPA